MAIHMGDVVDILEEGSRGIVENIFSCSHGVIYLVGGKYFHEDEIIPVLTESEKDARKNEYNNGDWVVIKFLSYDESPEFYPLSGLSVRVINYGFSTYGLMDFGNIHIPKEIIQRRLKKGETPTPYDEGPQVLVCEKCSKCFFYDSHAWEEDRYLCPECRKREFITPYHGCTPHLQFFGSQKKDDLFLGVEIEVDKGGEDDNMAGSVVHKFNKNGQFVYCSHDGSLTDGFEIITQPATLGYHESIGDTYSDVFSSLIKHGYRAHNTLTAGIHVHFSRAFFAPDEESNISKLLYLVEKFWDDIVIFSRRDYQSISRYAKKLDCPTKDFISKWNKRGCHDSHYYAVNISNPHTIELRMFRGTLNFKTFMAILQFVDKMATVVKKTPTENIQSVTFHDLCTPLAWEYYTARKEMNRFEEQTQNKPSTLPDYVDYLPF